jgi:hypothetical protein
MSSSAGRAGRPLRRLRRLRRLLWGHNELRRPADRIETAVIVTLATAFLTTVIAAACLAGHLYQSQRPAAARLRPTVAVLSQPGPVAAMPMAAARARWESAWATIGPRWT